MNDKKFQMSIYYIEGLSIDDIDKISLLENGNQELQLRLLQYLYINLHRANYFIDAIEETIKDVDFMLIAEEFWDLELYCNKALQFYSTVPITQYDLLKKTAYFYIAELLERNLHYLLKCKVNAIMKWAKRYGAIGISDDELNNIVSQYNLDNKLSDFCKRIYKLINLK